MPLVDFKSARWAVFAGLVVIGTGCALVTPEQTRNKVKVEQLRALEHHNRWEAPAGRTSPDPGGSSNLGNWYQSWNDGLLLELQKQTLNSSPSLEAAQARVAQSRALLASAQGSSLPSLDLNNRVSRARNVLFPPGLLLNTASILLDAAWEIDVWGANAMRSQAADQRLLARVVSAQELSAALASEVAQTHLSMLACAMAVAVTQEDTRLVAASESLVRVRLQAGLAAAPELNLASRQLTEARQREIAQAEQCDLGFKAMSALSLVNEARLREMYAPVLKQAVVQGLPKAQPLPINALPAQWIGERPDLVALALELEAAQFDIGVSDAARYPRLGLTGQVGPGWLRSNSIGNSNGISWSIAPTLGLPLFDGGRRKADVNAAKARYAEAAAQYRERAAQAVREVEEAMVKLQSAQDRLAVQNDLLNQTNAAQVLIEQRLQVGLAAASELADGRRQTLSARQQVVVIQREALLAKLALYKALGSGWQGTSSALASFRTPQ
jgi:outer membrane protein, multidrug efflux system